MKLLHLSDLHLGKRVNGFSMIEDQEFILNQILELTEAQRPDGVILAGDVYDKSIPSAEAVELFDRFLSQLAKLVEVYIISGNHDSAERIAFGGALFAASRVYVSPVYSGSVTTIERSDEFGKVCIHLLPFLKPGHVRRFFPDAHIESYTDAIRTALSGIDPADGARHVLVTHQLVTGAERSDSEELSIGGSDNVDLDVFDGYDYVALGHLHRPQNVGSPHVRYCGSCLKYSFSEANHEKSVTLVELGKKGCLNTSILPLTPRRDLRQIRGTYLELTARDRYFGTDLPESYLHVILTDEEDIPDALGKLRSIYPYIMKLSYDNRRTRLQQDPLAQSAEESAGPMALFDALFEKQNNRPLDDQERAFLAGLMEDIWEVI